MVELIPSDRPVRVTQSAREIDGRALSGSDAALLLIDQERAARILASLPFPALWRRLHQQASRSGPASVLASRVPNERLTMVAIGLLKSTASAFDRLALAGRLWKEIAAARPSRVLLAAPEFDDAGQSAAIEALVAAVLAGDAPMPDMRSKPGPRPCVTQIRALRGSRPVPLDATLAASAGNHLARWLTTLPPNHLNSVAYRDALRALAKREGWTFHFYDETALEKLGAGAFLAVSRANAQRGAGIARLTYRADKGRRDEALALVGKGICFDTGGINLKPHKSMFQMHEDMQGSAVAIGTLLALSRLKVAYPIECWLALTENEIGPLAYRPQEVVTAVNGITIQVVHSDAEGRMALADTLALAARENPALILDFATLTGACVNALTERYSGVFTNRPGLLPDLQHVGQASGERVWGFPLDSDFDSDLESRIADVLQCAVEGKGDHILAARFLSRFAGDQAPWIHMDLSSGNHRGGLGHVPTDVTGFGVRFATWMLHDERFASLLTKDGP